MSKNEIRFSGLTYSFDENKGVDLKISKLSFMMLDIPDAYCVFINNCDKKYKHRSFELEILKNAHLTPKKQQNPNDFFSKPFESKKRWEALEDDNLSFCNKRDFMKDIIAKRSVDKIFKKFLIGSFVVILVSFLMFNVLGFVPFVLFCLFVKEVAKYDERRITSVIFYFLNNDIKEKYKNFVNCFKKIKSVKALTTNENSKPYKQDVKVEINPYDLIKTNVNLVSLRLKDGVLVFFPDRLYLFYDEGKINSYDYDDLVIKHGKVKLKRNEINYFLSIKNYKEVHFLFYFDDLKMAEDMANSLIALQIKKPLSK